MTRANNTEPILRIPDSVRQDVLAYRGRVDRFLAGETSAVAFRAYRVPMGIYEQRTTGHYMVRVRIGAGLVTTAQLRHLAQLSTEYGNGILHVTTRQDIQIHDVKIEDTPDVLEKLLAAGLAARGGGGNTVRNVSACPGSGICPNERFAVAPHAVACAEYLLQDRSSFNLPRKYKIAFSGCQKDCALASVADLGFFAAEKNGVRGFTVYAGGGLGPNAAVGVKVEDFVTEAQVFEVAEAVKRLFDKHGDRANRHKARLRYVLKRVGEAEFVRMYKQERMALVEEGLTGDTPLIRDVLEPYRTEPWATAIGDEGPASAGARPEKTPGLWTLRLTLRLGDISAKDLHAIAEIAERYGSPLVRTTQLQNLLITGISGGNVQKALDELSRRVDSLASSYPQIVACTGAATCKLGLCLSRGLAAAIAETVQGAGESNEIAPTIRISGCPNSCGHHCVASIGFQGRAKRVNGRLMPCYDVMIGGQAGMGKARLGEKIGTVPAKAIPDILLRVFAHGPADTDLLKQLVDKHGDFSVEFPDDYFHDFGSAHPFSLAGRGPGECGAGVIDVITLDIDEAHAAIAEATRMPTGGLRSQTIYRAVVSAARALLVTFGLEPRKDREVFTAFAEHLIAPGWIRPDVRQLLDRVIDFRMGDAESIEDLLPQAEELVGRVDTLYKSLDASLKFRAEPVAAIAAAEPLTKCARRINLQGVACPLNFVKAKLELEKIGIGEVLEILLDGGEPIKNVPASFADQGQEVVKTELLGNHWLLAVRRTR